MSLTRDLGKALRITLCLWLLVAVLYPALILGIGQIFFPIQANGSLLKNSQGTVIGSALIGQPFSSQRYFHSRPSTTNYSAIAPKEDQASILKTGVSGASNLAPSNPDLGKRIQATYQADPEARSADLLYTSGSSLDPHITPAAAAVQVSRIAATRNLDPQKVQDLISQNTDGRFLGLFGEPGVNVLKLNLALDSLS